MDEVRLWRVARSQQDILAHMRNGTELVGHQVGSGMPCLIPKLPCFDWGWVVVVKSMTCSCLSVWVRQANVRAGQPGECWISASLT